MLASDEVSSAGCAVLTRAGATPTPIAAPDRLSARDIASLWKLYGRFDRAGAVAPSKAPRRPLQFAIARQGAYRKHPATWSFTRPAACM